MRSNVEKGWNELVPVNEEGYFTNGSWLLLADPENKKSRIPKGRKFSVPNIYGTLKATKCDQILLGTNGARVVLKYFATTDQDDGTEGISKSERLPVFDKDQAYVVFQADKDFIILNQCNYNVIVNRYPKATWKAMPDHNGLVAHDDLGPVGAVMGLRMESKKMVLPCLSFAASERLVSKSKALKWAKRGKP